MSEETVGGILRHKDTRHVQVRLDYMLLYRNEAKAKIIRVMETWTMQKRADWYKQSLDAKEQKLEPPEEELWVTMSYEQFSIFAYGTMKHDNIKTNVDDLVKERHLFRRVHPTIPYGPPQYLLNIALVQAALDEQEVPSLIDDISKIAPPRKKRTPQVKYPQGGGINQGRDPLKIPPGTGDFTYPSNNSTENSLDDTENKDEEGVISAHAESDAPADNDNVIDFEERKTATDGRLKAIKIGDTNDDSTPILVMGIDSRATSGNTNRKDDDAETVKMPAIAKGNRDDRTRNSDSPHGRDDSNTTHVGTGEHSRQERPAPAGTDSTRTTETGQEREHITPVSPVSLSAGFSVPAEQAPQAPVAPAHSPLPRSVQRGADMAMTAKQIKAQAEQREKELWIIIEVERGTTYTTRQRTTYANKEGMACLIADDISDETLRAGLQALDAFQRKSFTVLKFYEWLPNLQAKAPIPIQQGQAQKQSAPPNYVDHERSKRNLEKLEARVAANGGFKLNFSSIPEEEINYG